MPMISYAISEYESQPYAKALAAEFRSTSSRAEAIWSITTGSWMNPLSQISRRSLESKADALAVALETSPLNGVFARRPDSSPVVLWLHDDGEDVSKAPTKVAVAFPDDFVLWGPSERPNDVAYAGISLGIDTKRPDSEPYDAMIGTDGFAELYREASLDDLDAHSGLRDRVIAAVRERRPDLSFGEEPAPEGTAPSP